MIPDITTNDFLKLFYHAVPYGWLEFTLLKVDSYPRIIWMDMPNELTEDNLAYLHEQNEYGYNVYFGVTVRSRKQEKGRGRVGDALFTRVLWVDMDSHDPQALKRLQIEKPSLIIDSGGGYHGYWLLNETLVLNGNDVPLDRFGGAMQAADNDLVKRTLKGLALHLQADVKVAEFARIMRLPGFKNTKPERGGALCAVIEDKLYTYDFEDLANKYAWLVKSEARVERPMPLATNDDMPPYVRQYLASGAPNGERNNTFNSLCWDYNRSGKSRFDAETDLAPRARVDGLPEHEIQATNTRVAARDRGMVSE
jgi:hypothetical protein